MIQRIQTIFYFLSGLCFGGEFVLPFATSTTQNSGIFSDMKYNVNDHIGLLILTGLGVVLSLAAVFMYGNRKNQMKTGYLLATIAIILPVIAVLIYIGQTESIGDIVINDGAGLYLPIGMILFAILGVTFTKKDEKLVKSMDRLR
ncbi:MAG: cytochrome bd-type quinol oxidase subunit 2 [Saprospiraceae bacterium]|jgi:cytochrome bd-type quinol oxidase subunit 2